MESDSILSNYLLKKSSLEVAVPFNHFEKLFPSNASRSVIKLLYEDLCKQRENVSLVPVQNRIEDAFNVPIADLTSGTGAPPASTMNRHSLESLNRRLNAILESIKTENQLYIDLVEATLAETKSLVDELSDLRYSNQRNETLIEDAYHGVGKLEQLLVFKK
ncbi:uncharacterized protein RJT20DRAFT_132599 [Scheffersomyces xylosifermentans]|uniref:uncharacterized protein n=1 Tax=Scheffersomyces xylosifermentans TaxID=1304137 RepID=UPI00315C8BCE